MGGHLAVLDGHRARGVEPRGREIVTGEAFLLGIPEEDRLAAVRPVVDRMYNAYRAAVQGALPARDIDEGLLGRRVLEVALPGFSQKRPQRLQMPIQRLLPRSHRLGG